MAVKRSEPQKTADNDACFSVSPPKKRNGETRLKQDLIANGLHRLSIMSPPRVRSLEAWALARADALRLHEDGWVDKALELGWEPLHLFGCSRDLGGNGDQEGLAVQLAGRTLLLMDKASAIIREAPRSYGVFNLRSMIGSVMLWELQENTRR
jgi:hypothetical protein